MANPLPRQGRRRGVALLFALAMLVLLSVFALSFVNLTRLERLASANIRLQVQAAALAEAGVAQACGQARAAARRRPWTEPTDWWAGGAVHPDPALQPGLALAQNAYGGRDLVQILSIDAASKLDVNLPTPGLDRALELLGLTPGEVATLLAARAARGGLHGRDELRELLGEERFLAVRDFITVHGTPRLTPQGGGATGDLPLSYAVPSQALSPVNLNAAPEQVLQAALANVEGRPIEVQGDGAASEWLRADFRAQRGRATTGAPIGISEATALRLARELIACRTKTVSPTGIPYGAQPFAGPFRTWAQLDAFLTSIEGNVITAAEHGLVLAVAHVDARHMGYNPDLSRRRPGGLFDKLSVTRATAPLSLGAAGVLEVRARGWLTDGDDKVLADAEVDRVVRVFTPVHFSSQAQLEAMWIYPDRSTYQSMPELVPRDDVAGAADPVDGHIRLTTEWNGLVGVDTSLSTAFRQRAGPSAPYAFSRGAATLRDRGVVAPDGAVVWRKSWASDGAQLRLASDLPTSLAQQGSLELWVKLAADQTLGTDEALLSLIVDDTASWTPALRSQATFDGYTIPARLGATVKVERFRGRLRATWFYWGEGGGAVSRFALALSEVQQDISAWQPGEWHHVAVSWRNTPQDFAAAQTGAPLTTSDVPSDGVTLWVDGSAAGPIEMFDYSALEPGEYGSVVYHTGKSISVPTAEGVLVGGYTHAAPAGQDVHSTGVTGAAALQRYTNATLDDVFVSTSVVGAGGAVARNRDLRFERNPGGVPAQFDLPLGAFSEVGCVAAEVEVPAGCEARLSVPSLPALLPRTSPNPLVLSSSEVQSQVSGGVLRVAVTLVGDGVTSPVLESFTVLLLPPIQVIEEDRDAGS